MSGDDRFSEKYIVVDSGCWIWTSARMRNGYGVFRYNGHNRAAHRVSYEMYVGPIPSGLDLDHLCRTRECVNWRHVEPVTRRENLMRGLRKTMQMHCKRGHPLTGPTVYIKKRGGRHCYVCSNELRRVRRAERRAK